MMLFQQQQRVVEENMSNLTSASGEASVSSSGNRAEIGTNNFPQQYFASPPQSQPPKKKRNLPGNPDPDAEVIALSPKTLLATNRFVCEICKKGFQRDQNLQLHRRGHNLPWKLKQRTSKEVKKKVYVCPEESCVHHDPSRALGDLTGIKKHFCRKHGEKKWKCDKCSKRYAVQSDWKAHSKTCGTREYRCDCGTLFSRRDSFITHRAFCDALAEESARATINGVGVGGGVVPNPLGSSSSTILSHLNLQTQLLNNNPQDLHAFSLKKEQQNFTTSGLIRPELPPWLASGPTPIDLSSSSNSILSTRLDQDHHFPTQQNHQDNLSLLHGTTPNPNPSLLSGGGGPTLPPYQPPPSAHMSATALLQKAAQMGATMSGGGANKTTSSAAMMMRAHHQADHSSTNTNNSSSISTSGNFGLNLSSSSSTSRDQTVTTGTHHGFGFGNKASGGSTSTNTTTTPSLLHDMMCSFSSAGTNTTTITAGFEDPFNGVILNSKKEGNSINLDALSRTTAIAAAAATTTTTTAQLNRKDESGGGGNGEGLTRDFLGLRPLSHSEILSMAALGNSIMSARDHQNNQIHKPW